MGGLSFLGRPEGARYTAVDGLRALSILWVVAFHAVLFYAPHLTMGERERLLDNPLAKVAMQGELGVDVFFVISGFLIGDMLIREVTGTGRIALGRFYWRRALRLLPAYYAVLLLCAWLIPEDRENAWANLLYVNNLLPHEETFVGWAWSLAIEEQFYAVFPLLLPLLLRSRQSFGWLVGLALASVALRAGVAQHFGLAPFPHVPPWFEGKEVDTADLQWGLHWDHLYSGPLTRMGALLLGVAVALRGSVQPAVRPLAPNVLVGIGIALMVPVVMVSRLALPGTEPVLDGLSGQAYLAAYHTLFAGGVALVLLACLRLPTHPLARVLGHRAFHPVAQLAYTAYLLNPIVAGIHYLAFAPATPFERSLPMIVGSVTSTFAAALLLSVLVERPGMRLRR